MWLIDMIAKLLTQKAEPDPNGTYRHPKIAVIPAQVGIQRVLDCAVRRIGSEAAMTGDFSSSNCHSDLTLLALTLDRIYCHPGPRAGIQRVLDCAARRIGSGAAMTGYFGSSKCHSDLTPISF
jgi:hypothetical protein